MKLTNHKSGITIGALFTIVSLVLTATFIVPIISVVPGVVFETIAAKLVDNNPYSNVGFLTILLISIVFVVTLLVCLFWIRRSTLKSGQVERAHVVFVFIVMYFLVHSLGFYIYWGLALDFRSDGQLIFSAVISHPFSSFAFLLIGILIDLVRNSAIKTHASRHKGSNIYESLFTQE